MRFSTMNALTMAWLIGGVGMTATEADVLFYGGDTIGEVVLENTRHEALTAAVYDDFTVTGDGWAIDAIVAYSAGYEDSVPELAEWEIRRGISPGDGGTLVASGTTGGFVWTPTGIKGEVVSQYVLRVDISGQRLVLPPGTYHVLLRPVMGRSEMTTFICVTYGKNGIGGPLGNGNSFVHSPGYGYHFRDAGTMPGQDPQVDFRYRIEGTEIRKPAPEPIKWRTLAVTVLLFLLSVCLFHSGPGAGSCHPHRACPPPPSGP